MRLRALAVRRQAIEDGAQTLRWPTPSDLAVATRLRSGTDEACTSNGLPAQREAHQRKLGTKHVEAGQLRFARAGEVASRDVDDLVRIAEVRGAHVFRIGICA
jgi:hypothetical protein